MTQRDLAAALGVHPMNISKYERGAQRIPEPVARLARRLEPKVQGWAVVEWEPFIRALKGAARLSRAAPDGSLGLVLDGGSLTVVAGYPPVMALSVPVQRREGVGAWYISVDAVDAVRALPAARAVAYVTATTRTIEVTTDGVAVKVACAPMHRDEAGVAPLASPALPASATVKSDDLQQAVRGVRDAARAVRRAYLQQFPAAREEALRECERMPHVIRLDVHDQVLEVDAGPDMPGAAARVARDGGSGRQVAFIDADALLAFLDVVPEARNVTLTVSSNVIVSAEGAPSYRCVIRPCPEFVQLPSTLPTRPLETTGYQGDQVVDLDGLAPTLTASGGNNGGGGGVLVFLGRFHANVIPIRQVAVRVIAKIQEKRGRQDMLGFRLGGKASALDRLATGDVRNAGQAHPSQARRAAASPSS